MTQQKKTEFINEQFQMAYPEGIENHYWQLARSKIIHNELIKFNLTGLKFLEIGCGRGTVVKLLRKRKVHISGVELSPVFIEEELKDHIVVNKNALALDINFRNSIDCILLLDVIEHIKHPDAFIKEIFASYQNAKYLIITVPAIAKLWSNYDEYYGHFRRYHLEDTKNLSTLLNFNLLNNRFFFHALYIAGSISLRLSKVRKLKIHAPGGILKLLHKLIAQYFYYEYQILSPGTKGTSIISIMAKRIDESTSAE